ncbi:MAG TPA: ATP-binding protein [Candidatus Saccharimonadales bacterium]
MAFLLIVLCIVLLAVAGAGGVFYYYRRRALREQKNYERGLKMVPLLIHLPPPSEDIEGNGRDTRDVIEENISKAQVIYDIISSTAQKGYKSRVYGQRHFAFEIVGVKGFVYFYAAVPVSLVEVVKQAVVSAYPAARLEEVAEHNIFSPIGKLTGTAGGELHLKESFAYPIATYQELKRDSMQALLNALSTLGKEDGAGVQILLRPAYPSWRKAALEVASNKRKGTEGKHGFGKAFLNVIKDVGTAFVKPLENHEEKKHELSALDQSVVDAIEDKTRHPGYEVLIRVAVSSNVSQRSHAILNNIVAAFSLFDAAGRNGFKFSGTKDIDEFITSYILRLFPQKENKDILNAVELATLFHFPDQNSIPTSQLERQGSKQVDGPRNIPEKGLLLGYNVFRGVKKPIRLDNADRARHMYAVGQTGTGKSTFLENLALQDMLSGRGFAFVDPHGDTAERLLAMVPRERTEDVIYFSPSDMEYPLGLNLFEFQTPDQKDFIIQEVLNMLYKLYDPQHQGIMGPRYEHLFRNAALTVMADPEGGTFIDIPKLFRDQQYVKQKLQYVTDQNVIEFWQKEMPQSQRSNEFGEVVSWFVSKFGAFVSNEMMRNIIGQKKSAFNLREVMDDGKVLLVNLSKGRLGQLNMQLLGMIFVMKFQAAAMSRANIKNEADRRDFSLYVDEFQNFSTDSFATIMSEARKYHLDLIVANQFTTQLTEEIRDAVFGNMGTIVSFRIGQVDVDALSRYFQPTFDGNDLVRVPNHNAIIRTLVGGVPTQPFSMATLPPLGSPNYKLAEALKQLSAAKYGRPRGTVEKEIFERMATKTAPAPFGGAANGSLGGPSGGFGGGGSFGSPAPAGALPSSAAPAPQPGGSFLNDWMTKRQQPTPVGLPASPWSKNPAAQSQSQPAQQQPTTVYGPSPTPTPVQQNQTPQQQSMTPWTPPVAPQRQLVPSALAPNFTPPAHNSIPKAPAAPAPKAEEPLHPTPTPSEGEIHLGTKHHADDPGDTIFIDQEGNLHAR